MTMIRTALAGAVLAFALSNSAWAQTPPAATTTPAKPAASATPPAASTNTTTKSTKSAKSAKSTKSTKSSKPRSQASITCSKQADEKNLHGAARKKFRADCKKSLAASTKAKTTAPKT